MAPSEIILREQSATSADGNRIFSQAGALSDASTGNFEEALILIHGLTASHEAFDDIFTLPSLHRPGRVLIRYDLRGHGRSDKPQSGGMSDAEDTKYTARTLSDDFKAVADVWKVSRDSTRITVVGWSIGCSQVPDIVRFYPGLIKGVIALCPFPWTTFTPDPRGPIAIRLVPVLWGFHVENEVGLDEARYIFAENFSKSPETIPRRRLLHWVGTSTLLRPSSCVRVSHRQDTDPAAMISAIRDGSLRYLWIHGTRDILIDEHKVRQGLETHIGKGVIPEVMMDCGHAPTYDLPEETVAVFNEFMDGY